MKFYKKNHNRFLDEPTVVSSILSCFHKSKSTIKRIKRRIGNLVTWFPIIWNDEQWDHYWFLIVLKKKFTRMKEYWEGKTNAPLVTNDETQKRILNDLNEGIRLIDALIENDYGSHIREEHEKKWGKLRWKRCDDGKIEPEHKIEYRCEKLYNVIKPVIKHVWFINKLFIRVDLGFKADTRYWIVRENVENNSEVLDDRLLKENLEREDHRKMINDIDQLEKNDRKALGEIISRFNEWWD